MQNVRGRLMASSMICGLVAAGSFVAPTVVFAQDAGAEVAVEEIIVTGSRIRRDTFSAPVPLAVVSSETIRAGGNTILGDALMDLPQLNPATNGQNSSSTLFLAGQSRADIRGLGPSRTLVLVDGRRHVFGDATSPAVDLNMIPSMMIERVEAVAGGASAVYGSEAIAGVLNIIMKKQQDGLELDAQVGVSDENDGEEYRLSGIWGGKFLDDRLNVVIGGEYARQEPVMQRDRGWAYPGIRRNNTLSPQPIIKNSRGTTTPFGTFQLRGGTNPYAVTLDVRDPTQVTRLSAECAPANVLATCQDSSLFYTGTLNALQGNVERGSLRGYADYRISDNVKAFAELSYARTEGYGIFQPAFSQTTGGGTMPVFLYGDNPYLAANNATAAQLRGFWADAGLGMNADSRAAVGRFWTEFGGRDVSSIRESYRAVVGMEGEFNALNRNFAWDWSAQYGQTDGTTLSYGTPYIKRVAQAVDAVTLNGQIVCRDAAARAAGCEPWNVINGPSDSAIAWAGGQSATESTVKQTVVSANMTTDLFQLPAGAVGLAFGAEYRKEESEFVQDAAGASGELFLNAIGRRGGEYDVADVYGEIAVPLLRDLPFAEDLRVEAAGRYSDYSSIGGVYQWRLAGEWAPIRDVRFRANHGVAVRAPNIVELYSPQSRNFTTAAVDPCDKDAFSGASAAQQAARRVNCAAVIPNYNPATFESSFGPGRASLPLLQGGNTNLREEEAETEQLGVVIQPRWVPGLQLSFDHFRYDLDGYISTVPINTALTLCYDSAQAAATNPACANVIRDADGSASGTIGGVTEVLLTNQNIAKVRVQGYDASIAYTFDLADALAGGAYDMGRLQLRLDVTRTYEYRYQGSAQDAFRNFAGFVTYAAPEWKGALNAVYSFKDLTLGWQTTYIGKMSPTEAFNDSQLTPYYVPEYFRHDVRASYNVNEKITVRGGVQNLSNEIPPYLPEVYTGTGTGS
ncbi:MAG: TonB-dependent receptor, partial [Caulobacter sp.]